MKPNTGDKTKIKEDPVSEEESDSNSEYDDINNDAVQSSVEENAKL